MLARAIISLEDVRVVSTIDPIVVLRWKGKFGASRKLLLREAAYDTVRHRTVLALQQIKETEMEISTQEMVIIPRKDGEGEPYRINPDSSTGIYVNASVESEFRMISHNRNKQE